MYHLSRLCVRHLAKVVAYEVDDHEVLSKVFRAVLETLCVFMCVCLCVFSTIYMCVFPCLGQQSILFLGGPALGRALDGLRLGHTVLGHLLVVCVFVCVIVCV